MSPLPAPDSTATVAYLDLLFGTADTGSLAVWTAETKRTAWFPVTAHAAAAVELAAQSAAGRNVYLGMGLQAAPLGPHHRGSAETVVGIPGAWDDLDLAGPAHARAALPATPADACAVLAEFPLEPTLLVHSGHGLYPLWLFKEVWVFRDERERRQAASLLARVQQAIRTIARRQGYDFETTSDLARVLRPAGVFNRKPGLPPVPVTVLADTGPRYTVEDLEAVLPDEAPSLPVARSWTGPDEPTADLTRILAGCGYLRHCRDDAATLDEPAWHAMISIVSRCRDGAQQIHALSRPYPRYDRDETDRKIAHALAANKPLRCTTIRHDRGGEPYCAQCPHAGRTTSPVVLGTPVPPQLTIGGRRISGTRPLRPREGVVRVG